MSEIAYTETRYGPGHPLIAIVWASLGNGDTGKPFFPPRFTQRSVHIFGTFGSGGSITLQGSNERGTATSWITLEDLWGDDLILTAAGLKQIGSHGLQTRPNVTAGDGDTDLTIIMVGQITK